MLIVGLGNPGSEYIDTRHNIGFVLADEIIRRYEFSAPQNKFKAEYSSGTIDGKKIHLVKPLTFMNNSGICVVEIASFYKIPPEEILVIHDELDSEGLKELAQLGEEINEIIATRNKIGANLEKRAVEFTDKFMAKYYDEPPRVNPDQKKTAPDEQVAIHNSIDSFAQRVTCRREGNSPAR